jgi:GT2 family glycosyltransferase
MKSPLLAPIQPARAITPRQLVTPSDLASPLLSVIIVNYRQWQLTAGLVKLLSRARSFRKGMSEIVIVDNHSPPHPLLGKLRRLDGVSMRRWGRNRGFARAVNEGVRLSRSQWVLLLNPDITVQNAFLDRLQELIDRLDREEPRTGIVGLGLRDTTGRRQPSTGPFPTLLGTLARLLLPRRWRKHDLALLKDRAIDWVTGCCLLVRRQVLDELEGLNPDFFLYYEDVDLCRRARQHGWEVRQEPSLMVVHHHPLHTRAISPYLRLLTRHALLTYACLYWPRWQVKLLARLVRAEAWLRRLSAHWRGDVLAARLFRRLSHLAVALERGEHRRARRQLARAVKEWERSATCSPACRS